MEERMLEPLTPWPPGVLTRIPNWVYQDKDVYDLEQRRIFQGAQFDPGDRLRRHGLEHHRQ